MHVALLLAILLPIGCADHRDASEVVITHAGTLELIGVSGTRLSDGDAYRVPLDSERLVLVGTTTREAFLLVNRGSRAARITRLVLADELGEWRLLAPTRAAELPLQANGIELEPGAGLDFDLALDPGAPGLRRARLEITWRGGADTETRHVDVWALAARAPRPTGPGPPQDN